jgi:hypothetical protein
MKKCVPFLLFGILKNFFHLFQGHYLIVGSKAESIMQRIGKIGPGVSRNVSLSGDGIKVYVLELTDDFWLVNFFFGYFLNIITHHVISRNINKKNLTKK